MSESAFDDYLAQWRDASPQRALAWLFLRPGERVCFGALAALVREWRKAVREVRESQVAAVKLGWWREEMQCATQGQARHPLTQALFADPRVRSIPLSYWVAPVDAAIGMLALPSPANVAAQCEAEAPFANAVAALETHAWFGLFLPAGSPQAAVDQLYERTKTVLDEPEFRQKQLVAKGYEVVGSSPREFAAYMKKDSESRGRAVRISGARAE